jgi:hypothetical protein
MALTATRDLVMPGGRLSTPDGYVLFCLECAEDWTSARFTYLHGFYVQCEGVALRELLRALGANWSFRGNRVMCPFCHSYKNYSVHEGFFRLWRSVRVPRAQFADAWACVDTAGWTPAGLPELRAAAEALLQGPRLPMMLGRDGPGVAPNWVRLGRGAPPAPAVAHSPASAPSASLPGAGSVHGWGAAAPAVGSVSQVAASASVPTVANAPPVAAYSTYPAAPSAPWGGASSMTPPTDAARLASLEARLASLEARTAADIAALQDAVRGLAGPDAS